LNLDLSIEHIATHATSGETGEGEFAATRYEVLAVLPATQDHLLTNQSAFKIEVKFDRELNLEELMPGADIS